MTNLYAEDDLPRINQYRVINELGNSDLYLKENGFKKILEVKIPINIKNKIIHIIDEPFIDVPFEIDNRDKKFIKLLVKPYEKGNIISFEDLRVAYDYSQRLMLNISNSMIDELLDGLNVGDKRSARCIAKTSIVAHEIGLRKSSSFKGAEGHLIHILNPEKSNLLPFSLFTCLNRPRTGLKESALYSIVIPRRWHELRVAVNEKEVFSLYEENEEHSLIAKFIEKKSWIERNKISFGREIHQILNFLINKADNNPSLVNDMLDIGKEIGAPLDIWLFYVLTDLSQGIAPKDLRTESSYFLKNKDYNYYKNWADILKQSTSEDPVLCPMSSSFELVSIDGNSIRKKWYCYKSFNCEVIIGLLKSILVQREMLSIMKEEKISPTYDGVVDNEYCKWEYEGSNVNPFLLAINGKVKNSDRDKYFILNLNTNEYIKRILEFQNKAVLSLGFKNAKAANIWMGEDK